MSKERVTVNFVVRNLLSTHTQTHTYTHTHTHTHTHTLLRKDKEENTGDVEGFLINKTYVSYIIFDNLKNRLKYKDGGCSRQKKLINK